MLVVSTPMTLGLPRCISVCCILKLKNNMHISFFFCFFVIFHVALPALHSARFCPVRWFFSSPPHFFPVFSILYHSLCSACFECAGIIIIPAATSNKHGASINWTHFFLFSCSFFLHSTFKYVFYIAARAFKWANSWRIGVWRFQNALFSFFRVHRFCVFRMFWSFVII